MTPDSQPDEVVALHEAVVRKRKGIQTVWIIPIVAALVGGWLWYSAIRDMGPSIVITFETAEGLEAGKTLVKYKDLEIGKVFTVRIDPSLKHVIVAVELNAGSDAYLVDGTRFWVVKPRIGARGVSGLSTIVSGAYIAADISTSGTPTTTFTGLEFPPPRHPDAEGLRIKLRASTLGSIGNGTPISYLQMQMGDVEGYTFLREQNLIEFDVFIEPEYADLVHKNSRFWNVSGINVSLSAEGFDVHAESLEAILAGGIAFGDAPAEPVGPPAQDGDVFDLLRTRAEAQQANSDPRRTIAYFNESIGGVTEGTIVEFKGFEVGKVLEVGLETDVTDMSFRMAIIMETYPQRFESEDQDPDEPHAERLQRAVGLGLRAQLGPANLITGARNVVLDFRPETPAVLFGGDSDLPEVPTIPSTGEAISEMVKQLPGIIADLRTVMSDVKSLLPELMTTVQETADAARDTLQSSKESVEAFSAGMPTMQHELTAALHEIAVGMRSVSRLADYLERHPEALLWGKGDLGGQ